MKTPKGEQSIECDIVLSAAGIVANLEGIGLDIDANMVNSPRMNPYVRTDGWDEEVAKINAKKAAA